MVKRFLVGTSVGALVCAGLSLLLSGTRVAGWIFYFMGALLSLASGIASASDARRTQQLTLAVNLASLTVAGAMAASVGAVIRLTPTIGRIPDPALPPGIKLVFILLATCGLVVVPVFLLAYAFHADDTSAPRAAPKPPAPNAG